MIKYTFLVKFFFMIHSKNNLKYSHQKFLTTHSLNISSIHHDVQILTSKSKDMEFIVIFSLTLKKIPE